MNVIDAHEQAKKLPLGHIDREKARAALKEEYKCHKVQSFWCKKFNKSKISRQVLDWDDKKCLDFCNELCDEVGSKHLKKFIGNSPSVRPGAGGHYVYGEIHCKGFVTIDLLIHELAHHNHRKGPVHGKGFTVAMDLLFQVAYKLLSGKDPKPHWVNQTEKMIDELFEGEDDWKDTNKPIFSYIK